MTEQQTVAINGFEEEERGWAVYDENNSRWVAVFACTHEDWSNDAESPNEAPSQEHAEELVNSGCADDNDDQFFIGSRQEVIETLRHHVHTDTDKLLRNLLALLDSALAGDALNDPGTPDETAARDALVRDYTEVKAQLAAVFGQPLDTDQDVTAFLLATEAWAL